jgi:hypothetical protein
MQPRRMFSAVHSTAVPPALASTEVALPQYRAIRVLGPFPGTQHHQLPWQHVGPLRELIRVPEGGDDLVGEVHGVYAPAGGTVTYSPLMFVASAPGASAFAVSLTLPMSEPVREYRHGYIDHART